MPFPENEKKHSISPEWACLKVFVIMAILFTVEFLLGFWIFFIMYWMAAPLPKLQNGMLLLGGYYFVYLISFYSLLVLWSWSVLVWLTVKLAERKGCEKKAITALVLLIIAYFLIFKYFTPFVEWFRGYSEEKNISVSLPVINMLLPLGLSFYLFNAVSLVHSVAKKDIPPPGITDIFLYVNFAPTFISGPVNRAGKLLPQIRAEGHRIPEIKRAVCLIMLALIKLFMLSSWLGDALVNPVFVLPAEQNGWDIIIAVYGWAWNIYFNFSGYTNLVTGIALLLGYHIPENFNHPYLATSLQDFWHRWHISLSNFIRDYIYFPLGGSRRTFIRTQFNIMTAMVLSGIWHGAGLNFLLWGILHGAGLVMYNIWQRWNTYFIKYSLPECLSRLLTFNYICFAWLFFRADSFGDVILLLDNLLHCDFFVFTRAQFWSVVLFNAVIIIYPRLVSLRERVSQELVSLNWYVLPLIIVPVLTATFFISPSGVPGFIYANF